jgi:hypothetical protein
MKDDKDKQNMLRWEVARWSWGKDFALISYLVSSDEKYLGVS